MIHFMNLLSPNSWSKQFLCFTEIIAHFPLEQSLDRYESFSGCKFTWVLRRSRCLLRKMKFCRLKEVSENEIFFILFCFEKRRNQMNDFERVSFGCFLVLFKEVRFWVEKYWKGLKAVSWERFWCFIRRFWQEWWFVCNKRDGFGIKISYF